MWPKFGKKSQKVLGLIPTFANVTEEKLVAGGGGAASPPPPLIKNRVNLKRKAQKYIYICKTWKFKNLNLNSQWHNGFYFIVI